MVCRAPGLPRFRVVLLWRLGLCWAEYFGKGWENPLIKQEVYQALGVLANEGSTQHFRKDSILQLRTAWKLNASSCRRSK